METQEKSSEKTHAGHAGIGEKAHKADQNEGTNIDDTTKKARTGVAEANGMLMPHSGHS